MSTTYTIKQALADIKLIQEAQMAEKEKLIAENDFIQQLQNHSSSYIGSSTLTKLMTAIINISFVTTTDIVTQFCNVLENMKLIRSDRESVDSEKFLKYLGMLSGTSNKSDRISILHELFLKFNTNDLKFFFTVLLRKLRLGIRKKVDTVSLLNDFDVAKCVPFRPNGKKKDTFDWTNHILEKKYDGERVFVKCENSNIGMYSRNMRQSKYQYCSEYFGKLPNCILDGEMMVYDTKQAKWLNCWTKKANHLKLYFYVFDAVSIDGNDLRNMSWLERQTEIMRHLKPFSIKGKFEFKYAEQIKCLSEQDFTNNIQKYVLSGTIEGLVVKSKNAAYNDPRAWIKVKRESYDSKNATFDVILVAGAFSKNGKWANKMTSFLMAVPERNSDETICYKVVGAVQNGFSVEEVSKINEITTIGCNNDKISKERPINGIACDKKFLHFPKDEWLVVEVKSNELTKNQCLKYPSVVRMRHDKNYHSATEFSTILAMMPKKAYGIDEGIDMEQTSITSSKKNKTSSSSTSTCLESKKNTQKRKRASESKKKGGGESSSLAKAAKKQKLLTEFPEISPKATSA